MNHNEWIDWSIANLMQSTLSVDRLTLEATGLGLGPDIDSEHGGWPSEFHGRSVSVLTLMVFLFTSEIRPIAMSTAL